MTSFTSIQKYIDRRRLFRNISEEFYDNPLLTSLYFAQLAYFSPTLIHKKLDLLGPSNVSVYRKNGIQVIFAEFDSLVVVAFKGQENDRWDEFKTDIQCWKTNLKSHKVHAGFARCLSYVSKRLHIDLEEAGLEKHVTFTGHSLGGALALLMGLEYPPTSIYTFGSPRVFNASQVANHFDDVNIVRVVTQNDFVTSLPPKWLGYDHIGDEVILEGHIHGHDAHRLRTYLTDVVKKRFVIDENG